MKETKRRIEFYSLYDHTGIEKHLEKMASKGWMITEIGHTFWKYRRIEPQTLAFSVVYYPKEVTKNEMTADRQEFIDLCSVAGWEFVMSDDQLHVFCNKNENAVPIETDAEIQVECIHKFAKSEILFNYSFVAVASLVCIAVFTYFLLKEPIETLSDDLYKFLFYPFYIPFSIWNIVSYLAWYKKAKEAAEEGRFLETKRIIRFEVLFWVLLYGFGYFLQLFFMLTLNQMLFRAVIVFFAVLMFFLFKLIRKTYAKAEMQQETKRAINVVVAFALIVGYVAGSVGIYGLFPKRSELVVEKSDGYMRTYRIYCDENFPLEIEDVISVEGTVSKEKLKERLLLIDILNCNQNSIDDDSAEIYYDIIRVNFSPLYDKCKEELLELSEKQIKRGFSYRKEDASVWNADEVYRCYQDGKAGNSFVVCWDDMIVDITFGWMPTDEQIAIASQKLMNAKI